MCTDLIKASGGMWEEGGGRRVSRWGKEKKRRFEGRVL
jgi:hypothetical protein